MATQHSNATSAQPIELSEGDLEQVTAGAMAASSAILTRVAVREDPCAGGQVTMLKR